MGIRQLLEIPQVYSALVQFVGGQARKTYVREYVRPRPGDRVLDIGCGPADILDDLPADIDYTGFDASASYIESARRRFGERGQFHCRMVSRELLREFSQFDLVLANGVLHHLDDEQAIDLLSLAKSALNSGGRLITLDGCIVPGQSRIARFLLDRDRGRFVRDEPAYVALANTVFGSVLSHIRHDLMRIPYTHIIIETPALTERTSFDLVSQQTSGNLNLPPGSTH